MKRRIFIVILLSLVVLIINNIITPWMTIGKIYPDFALVLLFFLSRHYGRIFGQVYGFFFGLLLDFLGMGSFMGLSALAKTVAGFLGGSLKNKKARFGFVTFYAISLFFMMIHFIIVYWVNYRSTGIRFDFVMIRYVIPSTIYSGIIYFLIDNIVTIENE